MISSPIRGMAMALALTLTSALVPVAAHAQDAVVAVVNGKEIKRSDLEAFKNAQPQLRQVPMEMVYGQLVDHLVSSQLIQAEAKKSGIENDPKVKARLEEIKTRLIQDAWLAKQVESKVSDADIKKKYDELVTKAPPREEVKARHILVETEDEAKDVIKQLQGGANFEELAKTKTKDPSGKETGGDLGYFSKQDMVQPFAEAAFGMKNGEVSKTPVKTQFGWHVIKVEDHRMGEAPKFEDVKDQVREVVMQETAAKIVKGLQDKAQVKRFNLDGTPAK